MGVVWLALGESARARERKKAKLAGKGEGRRVEGSVEAISGQGRVPCSLCALCGASSCDDRGVDLPTPKELGTRPSSSASSPVSSPVRVTLKPGAVAPPLSPGGGCSLLLIRPRRDCVIRHRSIYFRSRSILLKAEHELDAVDLGRSLGMAVAARWKERRKCSGARSARPAAAARARASCAVHAS